MEPIMGNEPRAVLLAVDKSEGAALAFDWAISNYCRSTDTLYLINVRRSFEDVAAGSLWKVPKTMAAKIEKEATEAAEEIISKYERLAAMNNIECKSRIEVGDERDVICREVLRTCADVLIVGSRGLNPIQRAFLGSVSEYVSHHAQCPVIIVKPVNRGTLALDEEADNDKELEPVATPE
eukprot:TRINITY_DN934_c0_g1_i2.p1 TRINITY_DN934_c0_g1~~TRINITY_DN934_c0_g1_i2.p1  ORF type:complete len:180 (-),score=33.62 TRINITY_DN934_c0_g1_i2:675-1214(-)